jgi:hypothetical protein
MATPTPEQLHKLKSDRTSSAGYDGPIAKPLLSAKDSFKLSLDQSYVVEDFDFWYKAPYPNQFNVSEDVYELYKAMKGVGTNDKKLIEIIGNRSVAQLQLINQVYITTYKVSLMDDISGDTSGTYKKLLLGVCRTPKEIKIKRLKKALSHIKVDEHALVDILCASTRAELDEIFEHESELKEQVYSKTTGHLKRIFKNVIEERQRFTLLSKDMAHSIAGEIHRAGEGVHGTENDAFIDLLTLYTPEFYDLVDKAYRMKWGGDKGTGLTDAILREVKGVTQKSYQRALIACTTLPWEYFSDVIFQSIDGLGTKNSDLVYVFSVLDKGKLIYLNNTFYFRHKKILEILN